MGRCYEAIKTLTVAILLTGLAGAGCKSKSGAAETPTSPTTPPPAAATRRLTFTPDSENPQAEGVSLAVASRGAVDGMITLAVNAHGIVNRENLSGSPGIHGMWGRVDWDASQLALDAFGPGALLQQGDVQPGCCLAGEAPIQKRDGSFPFSVQRMPDTAQVTGSGEVVIFRLKPIDGVTAGTVRLDFKVIQPGLFNETIRLRPYQQYQVPQHFYGGVVTIQ